MKLLSFTILFLISVFNSNAQQLSQNNVKTTIDFKIKNIGVYVDGNFNEIIINSNFNKENLETSFINAIIKVNSINTNSVKRDKHLLKSDFFDAANYATIKLVSTKIEKILENKYSLFAKLTIKNITKSIVIPLEIKESNEVIIIKSNFKINRRDFNVGGRSLILSNIIKIQVVYNAEK